MKYSNKHELLRSKLKSLVLSGDLKDLRDEIANNDYFMRYLLAVVDEYGGGASKLNLKHGGSSMVLEFDNLVLKVTPNSHSYGSVNSDEFSMPASLAESGILLQQLPEKLNLLCGKFDGYQVACYPRVKVLHIDEKNHSDPYYLKLKSALAYWGVKVPDLANNIGLLLDGEGNLKLDSSRQAIPVVFDVGLLCPLDSFERHFYDNEVVPFYPPDLAVWRSVVTHRGAEKSRFSHLLSK